MAPKRPLARSRKWLILLIGIMMGASLLFGVLAWREWQRARSTTELLLTDYSEFVTEKFVRNLRIRYERLTGTWTSAVAAGQPEPAFLTQDLVTALEAGSLEGLLEPVPPVRYFFLLLDGGERIEHAGSIPAADEEALRRLVEGVPRGRCPAGGTVHVSHFSDFFGSAEPMDWSGVLRADAEGRIDRIAGFRLAEGPIVDTLFAPLIEQANCCPSEYLPAGIAGVNELWEAASVSIRDARGDVVYESALQYGDRYAVERQLTHELPLPGWSIHASINPEIVQPLLPNRGEAFPWFAMAIPSFLMLGSLVLTVRAFKSDWDLYRLQQSFIAGVSHELRTPLTRIRLFNELRSRTASPDKRRRYTGVIDRESRRLTFLVENLLDFSQQPGGLPARTDEAVDMSEVAAQAADLLEPDAAGNGRVTVDAACARPVAGDSQALFQLVVNLIDNGLKYSPESAPVQVSIRKADDRLLLEVADEGCGIPASEQGNVFEEFYRVEHPQTRNVVGSGIGLTLVRRTVEAHRGSIEIDSDGVRGTRVRVWLPLADEEGAGAP